MKKVIKIFDTTLRDGEQMSGVSLNIAEKLRIALILEEMNVDVIEAGFPASSDSDTKAVRRVAKELKTASVAALARANKDDIDKAAEALSEAVSPILHIFIATSDIHLEHKLKMSREEVLSRVGECVAYAKTLCPVVQFSPEDATRSDFEFLKSVLEKAIEVGADIINIADTVGYSVPDEFGAFIAKIKSEVKGIEKTELSVHCHNDLGLATANSLSAVLNGASRIDCTVNGIGERAGNTSLEEVVMAIRTREEFFGFSCNINTKLLTKASRLVSSLTGVYVSPNKSVVGKNVFCHESGIHQHGILSNSMTYEIMTPQSVGLSSSTLVLGRHSGHHAFEEKAKELGYKVEDKILKSAFASFKNLCCRKSNVTDEDIRALIDEAIIDSHIECGYELDCYQTQSGNQIRSMAMISLNKGKEKFTEAAVGEGPIDAAFEAVNKIVGKSFLLISYNIKAVTGGTDALGEVRVRIADEKGEYNGRGFSTNIIESSIKAYINAINRALASL